MKFRYIIIDDYDNLIGTNKLEDANKFADQGGCCVIDCETGHYSGNAMDWQVILPAEVEL